MMSSVNLEKFTELDDAAAKVISEYKGRCLFLGVTSLSDVAAESLCKFEGWRLRLDGLTNLSEAAAESLSNHPSFANKD